VLKYDAQNLNALILAAGTAATRQEAMGFLKQAQVLSPGNPEILKSLEWARLLPTQDQGVNSPDVPRESAPAKPWWVSQPLPASRKRSGWIYGALGLGFLLLTAVIYFFSEQSLLYLIREHTVSPGFQTSTAGLQSTPTLRKLPVTWTPSVIEISDTPISQAQTTPAYVTATPLVTLAIAYDEVSYPPVDFDRFYEDPAQYDLQRLSIVGSLLWLGEIEVNDSQSFALLIEGGQDGSGTAQPRSPILVVDVVPGAELSVGAALHIFGVGYQPGGVVGVQGLQWDGPVIIQHALEIMP